MEAGKEHATASASSHAAGTNGATNQITNPASVGERPSGSSNTRTKHSGNRKPRDAPTHKVTPAPHESSGQSEFVCQLRYSNTLPDLPFDPKCLIYPFDPLRFVRYTTTSLERTYKHVLHTETDLGIPIDMIDPEAYKPSPASIRGQLDPEDAALFAVDETAVPSKSTPRRVTAAVPWLRSTEYMAGDVDSTVKRKGESIELGRRRAEADEEEEEGALDKQIEAIEESFRLAKQPPVHPTNPELLPIEVLPVLPGDDLWGYTYTYVVFDSEPIPELQQQEEYTMNERKSRGIIKKDDKFVAYLLPKRTQRADTAAAAGSEHEGDQEFEWVREYKWHIESANSQEGRNHYFFRVTPEGVFYNEIAAKVSLQKLQAREKQEVVRASKVTVRARPATEVEEKAWTKKREPMAVPL